MSRLIFVKVVQFNFTFSHLWEKKPKLIKRNGARDYYSSLLSTELINTMLKENYLEYTKNVDITSYRDGVRETHNPEGRAVSRFHSTLTQYLVDHRKLID